MLIRKIMVVVVLLSFSAIACDPSDITGPRGMENYNEGVKLQQDKKSGLAEQQFKLALKNNPDLAEAHLNLGLIYMENEWLDGAESSTKQAIAIFERTNKTYVEGSTVRQSLSLAYNNLGAIEMGRALEAENQRDISGARSHWQKGMNHFRKAIDLDSANAKAQGNIRRFGSAY